MAEDKIIKVNKRSTRAKVDVSTFNREARTVEVTFATPTPVRTYYYEIGDYMEVLSCDPSHVNLTRLKNGAPVLDNHDKYGSVRKSVVGVVEDAWIDNGVCVARLRFSDASPEDVELMNKVADGIITGVSVGYDVYKYQLIRAIDDNSLPTYTAIDWEGTEISFTPVQADQNSRVRSESDATHEVVVEDVTPVAETEPEAENETDPETEDNKNENNNNNMTEAALFISLCRCGAVVTVHTPPFHRFRSKNHTGFYFYTVDVKSFTLLDKQFFFAVQKSILYRFKRTWI